ncbi:protein arginine methyltransferase NDUFAF7 homolog, mitochondrial [Chironomus tepperi]|uniref:protein arginine methyltransferase NDUFAF7 homolog, mitochondrial n=1 Tax=Chironomus tepperi TaxID=113505 RepID=UPI00391FC72A
MLINRFIAKNFVRYCSYKPIKRVNLNSAPKKAYVEKKLKEFDLEKVLRSKIEVSGPMTVASYMKEILTNPSSGYYMSRDVFGLHGDFITSPEISQIFGELVAAWCLIEYQKIGSPKPLQIVELGPGRGTLIQDILRVCSKLKIIPPESISIHLVELSPYLSKLQSQKLCYTSTEFDKQEDLSFYRIGETLSGSKAYWHRSIEDVPKEFSIILAHEFFDALPVHKLQKEGNIWKEILVDIDPANPNKFRFISSRNETPISKLYSMMCPDEKRSHVEISPETDLILKHIAERIEEFGGFGLIMDYGHFGEKGDTFRAFRQHKLHDPLVEPGTADLTADVNFLNMKNILEADNRLITFGPIEQGVFLNNMGAKERLEVLLKNCDESQQEALKSGYDMIVNPEKMGTRFKFLSLFPSVLKDHLTKFPVNGF